MPSAHESAVEAMAEALCRPAHVGPDDVGFCVDCEAKARKQVAALVTSEAVREALREDTWLAFGAVDAILAALAPEAT